MKPIIDEFVRHQRDAFEDFACRQAAVVNLLHEEREHLAKKVGHEIDEMENRLCSAMHSAVHPASSVEHQLEVAAGATDAEATDAILHSVAGSTGHHHKRSKSTVDLEEPEKEVQGPEVPGKKRHHEEKPVGRIAQIVSGHHFDMGMGITILLNMTIVAMALQWSGYNTALGLNLREDDGNWSEVENAFNMVLVVFEVIYVVELVLRFWSFGWHYFTTPSHFLDIVVALAGVVWIASMLAAYTSNGSDTGNDVLIIRLLGLLKLAKLLRLYKVVRAAEHCRDLRFLIRALNSSLPSLLWSMVFIGGVLASTGIFMSEICKWVVSDESVAEEHRIWFFENFGYPARASWTMFECTFTGRWPGFANTFVDEFHMGYSIFWLLYVVFVNFAVMRVVGALFLKQTMAEADLDHDRLALEALKHKQKVATQIQEVFAEADTSGDGMIDQGEFYTMLESEKVEKMLSQLDIDSDEAEALFSVLSADDGHLDYTEFLTAALKMKGTAKTMDAIQMQASVVKIAIGIQEVKDTLSKDIRETRAFLIMIKEDLLTLRINVSDRVPQRSQMPNILDAIPVDADVDNARDGAAKALGVAEVGRALDESIANINVECAQPEVAAVVSDTVRRRDWLPL